MAQDYGTPGLNTLLGGVTTSAPVNSPTTPTSGTDYGTPGLNTLLGGASTIYPKSTAEKVPVSSYENIKSQREGIEGMLNVLNPRIKDKGLSIDAKSKKVNLTNQKSVDAFNNDPEVINYNKSVAHYNDLFTKHGELTKQEQLANDQKIQEDVKQNVGAWNITENTLKGTVKGLWNFIGVGQIQDFLDTPEGQQAALNLTGKDIAKSVVPAATQFVGTPIADVVGVFTGPKTYTIPSIFGDTKITNIQQQTKDAVNNGENPYIAIFNAVPQSIFDGLMVAGLAEKAFSPREKVIATGVKTNDLPSSGETPQTKSFRLQKPITSKSSPVPNELIEQLQSQGVELKGYDPKNPTYFRTTPKGNGVLKGEIVQLRPSYFDLFKSKFGGDIYSVPKEGVNVVYESTKDISTLQIQPKGETVSQLHPTLLAETADALTNHGPDITHQALTEHLGATPEQASHIINTAQEQKIAEARANPEKAMAEVVKKVAESAEEFVKAQLDKNSYVMNVNKKVYRGEGKGIGNSTLVDGQYFADSKEFASQFGNVSESVIPKGSKVFDLDKVKSGSSVIPQEMLVDNKALTKYLIDNGFDYTRNTNTRGVEFVKLNKTLNELETLASKSKSLADFKQKAMANYDTYRDEIARLSKNYTNADISRLRDPLDDIYRNIENKGLPKTKSQLKEIWNKANETPKVIKEVPKTKEPTYRIKPAEKVKKVTPKKQVVKTPNNKIKEDISKLYDNVLAMYKKEMPYISDSIHEKNVEHLLKLISSNNVKALSNFLNKDNPTSQEIFAELTGKIWGKGLNQTIIKNYKGNYMQDILERNKPAPEAKVPEHIPGESIGIKITGEEYRGSRDGLPVSIPLEVTIDGDIKYQGKTVANIETLDMDNLNDALDDEGVSFIYKDSGPHNRDYDEEEIIRDAFKQLEKERDQTILDQYKKVFGKAGMNMQGGFINPGKIAEDLSAPVKAFLKEDVLPTGGAALEGFKNTMAGIVNVLAPTVGVNPVDLDQIMKMKGAQDKQDYIFAKTNEIIKKSFDKMTQQENVDFIDRMKKGEEQPTEALQIIADGLRKIDTATWEQAKEFKPSLDWKENHFRVMWKVIPGKPQGLGFKGAFKRPLQGTKGFAKQSTLVDMSEGLAKGGVPITYNPIEMFQYAYSDMQKFITAQKMIAELKGTGQMKFYPNGKFPDNGYVHLDDYVARVYMPVETATGGTVITPRGEWYIEPNIGRILNNYLSKDLIRASDFGRGLLAIKNVYTAIELSLSPFHAVFESLEAMGSQIGLGIQQVASGQFGKGLKNIVTAPVSPYSTAKLGADAIKFMTGTEADKQAFLKKYPDAGQLMTDLFNGGGRMKMDDAYRISTAKVFKQNLKSGNYIGAGLRALPALSQKMMEPLFDTYIPRLKVGTFLKEYSNDLVENSKELAEGTVTRETLARKRWNFVEDRFGEMNFDNLFWNKTFKTSMQILFRSVTWKMGNLRGTGGAIWGQGKEFYDAARGKRAPRLNPKMAWLLGMSVITAIIGYTMQKALTGKDPKEVKDYIYPQIDDKGNRISTPTYWKDVFHLAHDPVGYVTSSMSGIWGKMLDVWQNKDFYNVEIHNDNDPFLKRAEDNMLHLLPVPFAVSSTISLNKTGAPTSKQAMGFFGFTKAPGYINQTDVQTKIYDVFSKRLGAGVLSQDDADKKNQKSDIRKAYQAGDSEKANELLQQAIDSGLIKDANAFIKNADFPGDIRAFKALPTNDQRDLIRSMTLEEINKYAWFVHKDLLDPETFSDISDSAKTFIDKVANDEFKEPVYEKGVLQSE